MAADAPSPGIPRGPGRWFREHARVFVAALGRLWRDLGATAMASLIVGLMLALPATLHLFATNVAAAAGGLNESRGVTLFLRDSTTADRGRALTKEIAAQSGIQRASYVSREQALQEFKDRAGMADAIDAIGENQLQSSILLVPATSQSADAVVAMVGRFAEMPEVQQARQDGQWLKRLDAASAVANRIVLLIGAALGFVVIVVIGNTIRLDIESRREELVVLRLIGAPVGFIRRPFLYAGLWYGLIGGVLAVLATVGAAFAVAGPVGRLVQLYEGALPVRGPDPHTMLVIVGVGVVLGIGGAWLAVSRNLTHDEIR